MSLGLHPWSRAGLLAATAQILASMVVCAPASGHSSDRYLTPDLRRVLGDRVEPTADGLFKVGIGVGEPVVTHGPDPAPRAKGSGRARRVFSREAAERPPVCATDYYQHVLVAHRIGTPDPTPDVAPGLRSAIGRMNQALDAAARESGETHADYKFLCDGDEIRIDPLVTTGESFEEIIRSARLAGFDRPNADYTIFLAANPGGGQCGIASYRDDERLAAENASNSGGGYAVIYRECWFDGTTPMHENAHNQGAVPYGAPHSTGTGGHCNEGLDVMCYTPDGGDRNQGPLIRDCAGVAFDCNADDYFDASPEPGEYLAGHWNLGSPLNRFVEFGRDGIGDYEPDSDLQPSPCHRVSCARRIRLGATVRARPGDGTRALYKLSLRRDRRELEVVLRGTTGLVAEIRRRPAAGPPACRTRPLTGQAKDEACRVIHPRRGRWYVAVRSTGAVAAPYSLVARAP